MASVKVWPQYLLTFILNIGPLCFGIHAGWLAPLEPSLMSSDSPLNEAITNEELTWLASLPTLGILLGTPIFGYFLQRLGRKTSCLIANSASIISFIIIVFAKTIDFLYVARFLCGFSSAGVLIVTPVYVSECVDDVRRAFLCGVSALFISAGVAIAYGFGSFCSYMLVNYIYLGISLIFLLGYFWIPESLVYLIQLEKRTSSVKCIQKLRGGTEENARIEIDEIYTALKSSNSTSGKSEFLAVFTERGSRKALLLAFGLMTVQQFCGINAFLYYLVQILDKAVTYPSTEVVTTCAGILQLIGSLVGPLLLIYFGRKSILIASGVLVSASLIIFAAHLYFWAENPSVIPTIAIFIYFFTYSSGLGTVPFVFLPEIAPTQTRGATIAIVGTWVGISSFLVIKFTPALNGFISLAGTCVFFTICTILGTLFMYFFIFETKNKTISEISALLINHKTG